MILVLQDVFSVKRFSFKLIRICQFYVFYVLSCFLTICIRTETNLNNRHFVYRGVAQFSVIKVLCCKTIGYQNLLGS